MKLVIDPTQARGRHIIVEICTPDGAESKSEPVSIVFEESSSFQCRIVVSDDSISQAHAHKAPETKIDVGAKEESSSSLVGGFRTLIKPAQWPQPYKLPFGRPRGSTLAPQHEALLRVCLAEPCTSGRADRELAAQEPQLVPVPVVQNTLSRGLTPGCQSTLDIQESAHHLAVPARIPGIDARRTSPRKGGSARAVKRFIGALWCPPSSSNTNGLDEREINAFRRLYLHVELPAGFKANVPTTMDTGADVNVMTKKLARQLGLTIDETGKGIPLNLLEGKASKSLGTVTVDFSLICNHTRRVQKFHVVHDMGAHQALLCAELTMQLGHLKRLECGCSA